MAEKRILFVVHSYYVRDTRPRRLATALAAAGWDVEVICAREAGEPARERRDGVWIRRLPARRRRGTKGRYAFEYVSFTLMALVAVSARFLRRRPRIVYVIGVPNFLVFSALVPRLMGARVLLDMRDPFPEFFEAKYGLSSGHPIVRALRLEERLSARFAGGVVTVHASMARLFQRSVSAERITVIMNAPDPRLFSGTGDDAHDPDDRTMLFNGSLAAHYGIDLAVRAVGRLRDEIPRLRLRILAKNLGDFLPELRRIAREEGVEDRIDFDDPVPLDQIPAVVRASWVGVQPGRDDPLMRYSLSQKVLEWSWLGLPAIVGETAPLREIFGDEVLFHAAGDLDDLCARIREADADPGLRDRAARARAAAAAVSYADEMARLRELLGGAA